MQTGMIPACLTSVEAEETLVAKHLLGTIEAVLVHQLSDKGPRGPLVLHTGLHQVNGVDCRRSRGYANAHMLRFIILNALGCCRVPIKQQHYSPPAMEPRVNL